MFAKAFTLDGGIKGAPDEVLLALNGGVVSCRGIDPEIGVLTRRTHDVSTNEKCLLHGLKVCDCLYNTLRG